MPSDPGCARLPEIARARADHAQARERIRAVAQPGTVLALPTAPCISPLVATPAEALESFRTRVMRLPCIAGHGGLPQVNLPIGSVAGAPAGLSFIGWPGGDEDLRLGIVKSDR